MTEQDQLAIANEAKAAADALMERGAWLCFRHNEQPAVQFYLRVGSLMRTGDTFEQAYQTCGGIIAWPLSAEALDLSAEQSRSA